jgi:predicted O-methyltransferase YrrM
MIKRAFVTAASLMPLSLRSTQQLALECLYVAHASQKRREVEGLLRMVRERQPRVVVEIGTRIGGTFYGLCKTAAPDATLVSIDLPGGPFGGGYEESHLPRLRSYARPHQTTFFIRGDSHDASTLEQLQTFLGDRPVDVLFIDGDHTYEGARMDYDMYAPLVRPGGLVAFHDIVPAPAPNRADKPASEVDRVWDDVKSQGSRAWEFVQRSGGPWAGIGVLEV